MDNNWLLFVECDGGSSGNFSMDPLLPQGFGGHCLSQITSFVDKSSYLYVPGSLALQEAFNYSSKLASALVLWFASGSNSNMKQKLLGDHVSSKSSCKTSMHVKHISSVRRDLTRVFWNPRWIRKSTIPIVIGKLPSFALKQLCKEAERLRSYSVLSLAAALVLPLTNVSSNVITAPIETGSVDTQRCMDQLPYEVEHWGREPCSDLSIQNLAWSKNTVEPRTGIEFPTMLDNPNSGESDSSFTPEVLVGTGSRTMTILRIKSLKIYAFGFCEFLTPLHLLYLLQFVFSRCLSSFTLSVDVHPSDVCEKLGPKYSCISTYPLDKSQEFYQDLLREDINMTVKLVVSCNGIKINTVRDAFEKSLRARLVKANPNADFRCLQTFGSMFSQEISLRVGTTINFRRTADGHLITEVGGNRIGSVKSKDLCRAFFDMYIGDIPVCEQTKQEIGRNVASIIH